MRMNYVRAIEKSIITFILFHTFHYLVEYTFHTFCMPFTFKGYFLSMLTTGSEICRSLGSINLIIDGFMTSFTSRP